MSIRKMRKTSLEATEGNFATKPSQARDKIRLSVAQDGIGRSPSPALCLQSQLLEHLNTSYTHDEVFVNKYPLKWTLIGCALFCSCFWYGLAVAIL